MELQALLQVNAWIICRNYTLQTESVCSGSLSLWEGGEFAVLEKKRKEDLEVSSK